MSLCPLPAHSWYCKMDPYFHWRCVFIHVWNSRNGLCVCRLSCHHKAPLTGGLMQQTFMFSVWRLEVQDQVAGRWFLGRACFLVCRQPPARGSPCSPPRCVGQREVSGLCSHSYKDTSPVGLGPHPDDFIQPHLPLYRPSLYRHIGC